MKYFLVFYAGVLVGLLFMGLLNASSRSTNDEQEHS